MQTKKTISVVDTELLGFFTASEIRQLIQDGLLQTELINNKEHIKADSLIQLLQLLNKPVPEILITGVIKIMIVDDEENIVNAIARQLKYSHIRTYTAHNGFELGRQLQSICPHILILDYKMPGMNGLDILKNLRSKEDTKEMKVIIHSGFLTDELILEIEALDVTHIIEKGSCTTLLIDKVKELTEELISSEL